MLQHPSILIMLALFVFVIGFVVGLIIGFAAFGSVAKAELRNRLSTTSPEQKNPSIYTEMRTEKRFSIPYPPVVSVKAPVLDSAGVPLIGEDIVFGADLLDMSKHGASILSKQFLPKGLVIEIASSDKKISFDYRRAEIRNLSLSGRGIKIGVQFFELMDMSFNKEAAEENDKM